MSQTALERTAASIVIMTIIVVITIALRSQHSLSFIVVGWLIILAVFQINCWLFDAQVEELRQQKINSEYDRGHALLTLREMVCSTQILLAVLAIYSVAVFIVLMMIGKISATST